MVAPERSKNLYVMAAQPGQPVYSEEKLASSKTSIILKSFDDVEQLESIVKSGLQTPSQTVPSVPQPIALKDGGVRAWLQVLGSFVMYFNLWGYTFAFGSFQNYYESDYLRGTSPSAIAWIGSIQSFLLILSGVFAGPLFDLGYFKIMIYGGAFLATLGAMMLSLSDKYWQIFLTQGVCVGLGSGLLFVPSMALVARSFVKRRSLAVGMMTCGAPVGAVIYSLLFEGLVNRVGFAWAARVMGFFMLATYAISIPLILWRTTNTGNIGSGTKRKLIDKAAFRDLPFWAYTASTSFLFMAYLTPYIYMPTYAQARMGTSQAYASYVLIISQAASIPGRICSAVAANQIGVMIPWSVCASVSAIMCFVWISTKTLPGFIVFCALYGTFSGALVALPPSVFPVVCPDRSILGTRLGMAQAVSSIANLIGPPIGGALLRTGHTSGQNWLALQVWCGLVLFLGVGCLIALWALLITKRNAPFKI